MGRNKIARSIYFELALWNEVDELATELRVTRTELVREGTQRAVDYYSESGRTLLGKAETLARESTLSDSPEARALAKAVLHLADVVRKANDERDAALALSQERFRGLLDLQQRVEVLLGHPE